MVVYTYKYDNGIELHITDATVSFTHRSGMLQLKPSSWKRCVLVSYRDGSPRTDVFGPGPIQLPINGSGLRMIDAAGVDGVIWSGCKLDAFHGVPGAPPAPSRVMVYSQDAKGAPKERRPYYTSYATSEYEGPEFLA